MAPTPDIVGKFQDVKDKASETKDRAKEKAGQGKETVKQEIVGKFQDSGGSQDTESTDTTDTGSTDTGSTDTGSSSGFSGGSTDVAFESSTGTDDPETNNPEDVRDRIIQDPDTKDPTEFNKKETSEALDKQQDNLVFNAANPGRRNFLKAREQNLEARTQLVEQEKKIENLDRGTKVEIGGQTVSKSQALQNIQSQKQEVDQNLQQNNQALVNLNRNLKNDVEIGREARRQARSVDLDREGNPNNIGTDINRPETGTINLRNNPPPLNGPGETFEERSKLGQFSDILLSSRGGELLASTLPGGKTPREIRESVARSRKTEGNPTFSRLGSPLGLAAGGLAGGIAFKTGTRALSSVSGTAGSVARGGGVALAGAETGKVTAKAKQDFETGRSTRGFERLINFGAASGGFLKGSRKLRRRVGSTKVTTKSIQDPDTEEGVGQFLATTNIVKPRIRGEPEVETQVTKAKFGRVGDTTKGNFESRGPTGNKRSGEFETVSIQKGSGTTPQGNKFQDTGNVVQTTEDGTLFIGRRKNSQVTRNIETDRRTASQEEVARSIENVPIRNDLEAVEIQSTGQDSIGSSTVFIRKGQGKGGGKTGKNNQGSRVDSDSPQDTIQEPETNQGTEEDLDIDRIAEDTKAFQDLAKGQAQKTVDQQSSGDFTTISGNSDSEDSTTQVQEPRETSTESFEASTVEGLDVSQDQVPQEETTVIQEPETEQERDTVTAQGIDTGTVQETGTSQVQEIKDLQTTSQGPIQVGQDLVKQDSTTRVQGIGLGIQPLQGNNVSGLNIQTRTGSIITGIPTNARAGRVGISLPDSETFQASSSTSPRQASTGQDQQASKTLDWISANAVEQQGEIPVFNLGQVENSTFFSGVKTVQENQNQTKQNQVNYF